MLFEVSDETFSGMTSSMRFDLKTVISVGFIEIKDVTPNEV